MKQLLCAVVLCAVAGAAFILHPGLEAATLTVTSANDSGPGSLRDAIALASSGDEIRFDLSLVGAPIFLTTGELLIDKNLTITGLGQQQTILDGSAASRIFKISESATVLISMVTVRNGFERHVVPDPSYGGGEGVIAEGGGLYNAGNLTLDDALVHSNTITTYLCDPPLCGSAVVSVKGAGIFNSGTLSMYRTNVSTNRAESDGNSNTSGGGLYNSGMATLVGVTISGNWGDWDRSGGLRGAGIFNDTSGIIDCEETEVSRHDQVVGPAIENRGLLHLKQSVVAGNGLYFGGGILNFGVATIDGSLITGNFSGAGGDTGGIENIGTLTVNRSTISYNESDNYVGGISAGRDGRIINSTIIGNVSYSHIGGIAGGIVIGSTIVGNVSEGFTGGVSHGTTLLNSLLMGNSVGDCAQGACTPSDCSGVVTSLGHNIIGDGANCSGLGNGPYPDIVGADWTQILEHQSNNNSGTPKAVLANNGGPTPTVALLPDSLAIEHIPPVACTNEEGNLLRTDQRGVGRPQGSGCDAGAFEFSQPRDTLFWTQQCREKNSTEYSSNQLSQFFASINDESTAFPECALADCDALEPENARSSWRAKTTRELLAVWLNLASGRLTKGRPIDLQSVTSAATVGAAVSEIEATVCNASSTHQDFAHAKEIAEALNQFGK